MNMPAQNTETAQTPAAARKFTYQSGARPLDGYTIKRGVGHGGFGEVYFAVSDAGKEVALKLIRRNLDVELRGVRQCLNLKHPNLLSIHDIRTDGQDDRWVVMEYIAGESLEQVIDRNPNGIPEAEALRWIRGIAGGVAYLHDHGVVHRDIKPGNLFLDEGIVKIGDYGLAKFVSCSRRSGQTESVGTVHYMAPEIANGRYGKEIDTYALGVLIYEMLTGHVPFEGESVGEVLMKHLTAEPDLSALRAPYRRIVARCLHKDPAQRIGSAKELVALLPGSDGGHAATAAAGAAGAGTERTARAGAAAGVAAGAAAGYVAAEVVDDEEPIWRALRDGFRQLNDQWSAANLPPLVKACVLLGVGFLLLSSSWFWFPSFMMAVFAYAIYRVVRAIAIAKPAPRTGPQPTRPPAGPPPATSDVVLAATAPHAPAATPPPAKPARARRARWCRAETRPVIIKTPREKTTELVGSMLIVPVVATAMTVVMMLLRRNEMLPQQFAWLAMVGTLASWAVMIPAKLWEGRQGEQVPRRFAMLVVGLALGTVAWGLAGYLHVDVPFELAGLEASMQGHPLRSHESFYGANGSPRLFAYFAYFGFLFAILRWWRQADPTRGARLSVWSTVCAVFAAWLLNFFWPFPQPWGFMLAATTAVSVQLASVWQPPRKRLEGGVLA